MTWIGSQDAAAAAEAQRHSEARRAAETQRAGEAQRLDHSQATHKGMRFATLHHGTSYAYGGNLEHARQIRSINTRNLLRPGWLRLVMRRPRHGEHAGGAEESGGSKGSMFHPREADVARRQAGRGGQGCHAQDEGGGPSDEGGSPEHRKKLRVKATGGSVRKSQRPHDGGEQGTRGGGTGGGSQQQRERQPADRHDACPSGAASETIKQTGTAWPLAAIAACFDAASDDPRHSSAMRDVWGHGLLDIVDWLSADPSAAFHLGMIQQVRRWLAFRRRNGAQPAAGLGPFVELTKQRAATRMGAASAGNAVHAGSTLTATTTDPCPRQVKDEDAPYAWGERVRDARLLAPLIWLNGDRPSANDSLDKSISRIGMQEAVIGLHATRTTHEELQADKPRPASAAGGAGPGARGTRR
ncbi:hypothetical protein [Paraburkholderia youngii]|uniref:Uncharacterized protein n=1 Tax=Paraburkholderia youngii TaxID=2782701 RepID=A0A7Y6K9W5_9BURK|nr:hypothetical protein [Paraburkholderia youngii]NUY06053.1 hypothetical protein [Paraburkholderia youngii]